MSDHATYAMRATYDALRAEGLNEEAAILEVMSRHNDLGGSGDHTGKLADYKRRIVDEREAG